MLIRHPNGTFVEVMTSCDFNPSCRDCPQYMKDCNGNVDHDPTLLEDCDINETPWGKENNE